MPVRKALFYELRADKVVDCHLCPHNCKIKPGAVGICGVRKNEEGVLYTLNYGEISSLALDPVEKKPLYHFFPGHLILSAGTFGCNLSCSFCQNYSIARYQPQTESLEPLDLVQVALQEQSQGSVGIAFTYNEPGIWYEFVRDTSQLLKEQGLKSVVVTNGYIQKKPLAQLLPYIDALNIDVKAFSNSFYRCHCGAALDHVKATVESAVQYAHVEIANLIIPGENDDIEETSSLARWLASLSPFIPLHLSRYHPAYKMSLAATPAATLRRAVTAAREHLHFVYAGNLPGIADDTLCPNCGQALIGRQGYATHIKGIKAGTCLNCGARTDYIIT